MVDVVLDRDREDAVVHERPDSVLNQALLVGQLEVHPGNIPILKDLLPGAKYEYSLGTSTSLLHRSQVVPDVPLCDAGN